MLYAHPIILLPVLQNVRPLLHQCYVQQSERTALKAQKFRYFSKGSVWLQNETLRGVHIKEQMISTSAKHFPEGILHSLTPVSSTSFASTC